MQSSDQWQAEYGGGQGDARLDNGLSNGQQELIFAFFSFVVNFSNFVYKFVRFEQRLKTGKDTWTDSKEQEATEDGPKK